MPVKSLELAAPFFTVDFVTEEPSLVIAERAIFLNLGVAPSASSCSWRPCSRPFCVGTDVETAVVVTGFDTHRSDEELFKAVCGLAVGLEYVARNGGGRALHVKVWLGHRPDHVHPGRAAEGWSAPITRSARCRGSAKFTQIVGVGKMQQCRSGIAAVSRKRWCGHDHRRV